MASSLSEEFVFEYFSHLNPIAYKIQAEINQTIENYEHLWNTIPASEQLSIINEAVIKPEIKINYRLKETPLDQPHLDQYRDIDASLLNYFLPKNDQLRPFSYKTKSQQNLFYSLTSSAEPENDTVRLPLVKPKNDSVTKSTDSLTCNLVNLNVKAKKGRAPAAPIKMTTKPPPPPPPTAKAPAKPIDPPPPVVEPTTPKQVIADIPNIPEDNNSNTSLLSPANPEEEQEEVQQICPQPAEAVKKTPSPPSDNDDEFKSLLSSNTGFDFLNNW